MKQRVDKIENRITSLEKTVESRAENHRRNNEAFAEIANDYTKLQREKDVLQEKLHIVEREQAVQQSTVTRMLGEIIEIKKEVKEFMEKVVNQLTSINTSIATGKERESTLKWIFGLIVQSCAPAFMALVSIFAMLKGLGKI